jgi:peroxiredoxin
LPVYYRKNGKSYGTPVANQEIKEIENLTIYPNPSSKVLTISNDFPFKFEIYNNLGTLIYDKMLYSTFETIEVENWPKGVYFIKLRSLSNQVVKKIIIN